MRASRPALSCRSLLLRLHLLGDVVALDEDAGDSAVAIEDRLVDEVQEALLRRRARRALQLHLQALADKGLAPCEHLVQQLEEALARDLGQRLAHGLALRSRWPTSCR